MVDKGDVAFDLDLEWRPIAPAAKWVWFAGAAGVPTVLLVALAVAAAALGSPAGAAASGVVLVAVLIVIWVLVGRRYRSWGYALRDDDLVLRRGVMLRRLTIVPFGRLQFVDVAQGPLDRFWNVANVQLHTAAAASDARIPLVTEDEAAALRDRLTALGEAAASGV